MSVNTEAIFHFPAVLTDALHAMPIRWHHCAYGVATLQGTANDTAAEEATEIILTMNWIPECSIHDHIYKHTPLDTDSLDNRLE